MRNTSLNAASARGRGRRRNFPCPLNIVNGTHDTRGKHHSTQCTRTRACTRTRVRHSLPRSPGTGTAANPLPVFLAPPAEVPLVLPITLGAQDQLRRVASKSGLGSAEVCIGTPWVFVVPLPGNNDDDTTPPGPTVGVCVRAAAVRVPPFFVRPVPLPRSTAGVVCPLHAANRPPHAREFRILPHFASCATRCGQGQPQAQCTHCLHRLHCSARTACPGCTELQQLQSLLDSSRNLLEEPRYIPTLSAKTQEYHTRKLTLLLLDRRREHVHHA